MRPYRGKQLFHSADTRVHEKALLKFEIRNSKFKVAQWRSANARALGAFFAQRYDHFMGARH